MRTFFFVSLHILAMNNLVLKQVQKSRSSAQPSRAKGAVKRGVSKDVFNKSIAATDRKLTLKEASGTKTAVKKKKNDDDSDYNDEEEDDEDEDDSIIDSDTSPEDDEYCPSSLKTSRKSKNKAVARHDKHTTKRNAKSTRRGSLEWNLDEDVCLKALVEEKGLQAWRAVAIELSKKIDRPRTGKQCRERWHNHLKPGIVRTPWSVQEERDLVDAHKRLGNKWAGNSHILYQRRLASHGPLLFSSLTISIIIIDGNAYLS